MDVMPDEMGFSLDVAAKANCRNAIKKSTKTTTILLNKTSTSTENTILIKA